MTEPDPLLAYGAPPRLDRRRDPDNAPAVRRPFGELAAAGCRFRDPLPALAECPHATRVFEGFRGRAPDTHALLELRAS